MKFKAFVLLACICSSVIAYAKQKEYETGKLVDIQTEQRLWGVLGIVNTTTFHIFRISSGDMIYVASSVELVPSDIAIGDELQFRVVNKYYLHILRPKGELKLVLEDRKRTSDASNQNPIKPFERGNQAHTNATVPATGGASVTSGIPAIPSAPAAPTMDSPHPNDTAQAQTPIEKQRKRDEVEHMIAVTERNIESNKESLKVTNRAEDHADIEKLLRDQMEHLADLYHQLAALQ